MSSLASCFMTLRLHLSHYDFDSHPLFLVSLFLSLSYTYIYTHTYWVLMYAKHIYSNLYFLVLTKMVPAQVDRKNLPPPVFSTNPEERDPPWEQSEKLINFGGSVQFLRLRSVVFLWKTWFSTNHKTWRVTIFFDFTVLSVSRLFDTETPVGGTRR